MSTAHVSQQPGAAQHQPVSRQSTEELSTGQLVSRAVEQISTLVKDELALAQAEMTRKAKRAGLGAGLLGGAGLIALYGMGCLVAAAILGLAVVVDAWLAAVIVGVVLLVVAGVLGLIGKKDVSEAVPAKPEEAVAGIKTDVDVVKNGLRR
jgi:hypothetical protein